MLPGKLCIGILEEDNPLKSYFRLKPVLIEKDGKFEFIDSTAMYPQDGCIRIVPDKNESGRFKGRMRRMGRYCMLDLRTHMGENDKIRPNKNFGAVPAENNAFIVYSDVVREPFDGMIFDIAASISDETVTTPNVLLGSETLLYSAVQDASGESTFLEPNGITLTEDEIQRFEIPGIGDRLLRFAIRPASIQPVGITSPAVKEPDPALAEEITPVPQITTPSAEDIPAVEIVKAEVSAESAPEKQPVTGPVAKVMPATLPPQERARYSQSGLNPRARMSLQEIIDERWRQSRVEQLGHPIPGEAFGTPVESPVERAVRAIRESWENSETRRQLTESITSMPEVAEHLNRDIRATNDESIRRQLEELEAERLMALAEIDKLRKDKKLLRTAFKNEIREEEAAAFADAVAKTAKATDRLNAIRAQIEAAEKDAGAVRDVLASLSDGRFEAEVRKLALNKRCGEILSILQNGDPCPPVLPQADPDRDEWMLRIKSAFAVRGMELTDIEAASLLICCALSDNILLSGPVGSDHRLTAEAIADALGATAADRFRTINPGRHHKPEHAERYAEHKKSDIPGIIWIPNANHVPHHSMPPYIKEDGFITISEVADSGSPLRVETVADAWMIRLKPEAADTPWHRTASGDPALSVPASIASLRAAFLSNSAELPSALESRLQFVRDALASYHVLLSRKTLNDMWDYCCAIVGACRIAPGEALDRAFAQRALPTILADAPTACLADLKRILKSMPISTALLNESLPIEI